MEVSGQSHSPVALPPGEKAPVTHFIGGQVGPVDGLNVTEKRKISCPYQNSTPDSSVVQPVA
jgi:hypothetical protein